MELHWTYKHFTELTTAELYAIIQLRNEVFVVEQNCPYQDADNKDLHSYHLMGWDNKKLVAYSRIIPKGISYEEYASLGRIVTSPAYRQTGAGKQLLKESIERLYVQFGTQEIKIEAQVYLTRFYQSFGFEICGEEYLEDNIPHIPMIHMLRKKE